MLSTRKDQHAEDTANMSAIQTFRSSEQRDNKIPKSSVQFAIYKARFPLFTHVARDTRDKK
jgi:hypothetical protein